MIEEEWYKDYTLIIEDLKNKKPFAFSRWGDGEWLNIKKHPGENCDGNKYYHDLGDNLRQIVEVKQDYYMGAQSYKNNANVLRSDYHKYPHQEWINADVFHKASMRVVLGEFVDILKKEKVFYIGNNDLKKLNFIDNFLSIPQKNVWKFKDRVMELIKDNVTKDHKIFLFSAGMAANVFIHELWEYDKNNTYIDVGSVFDPYVDKFTRGYHKKVFDRNIKGKNTYVKD